MSNDYIEFFHEFRAVSGLDLSHYNKAQIQRRLSVFQQKHQLNTLSDLITAIREDRSLLRECMKRLTINVTEFYRDPAYWDILKTYISGLTRLRLPLKMWSAGCATGEEAYSLAGMVNTMLPRNCWELVATDLDADALAAARAGLYTGKAMKGLDAKQIALIFTKTGEDQYSAKDRVREQIKFFRHDLLQDPYPVNLDIILCRNVIIYFKESTKKAVIAKLAKALNPGGLLFVGGSEQIMNPEEYDLINENVFFYKKRQ